jgi:hypothetical protein
MIILHMVASLAPNLKKTLEAIAPPNWRTWHPEEAVEDLSTDRQVTRSALVQVLERAADEPAFIAQLTKQGSLALKGYRLSQEEKAALASGDIGWLEARLGKLDGRLRTWPDCRLQQEIW